MYRFTTIWMSLVLLLAFSAAPTAPALACGKSAHCCKKEVQQEDGNCCKPEKTHHSSSKKKGCDGKCGKNGCPCPQTTNCCQAMVIIDQPASRFPVPEVHSKTSWYFLNRIPQDVFLAVWLPPKI